MDPNASVQLQEDDLTKVKFKDEAIIEKKKSIVLKPSRVSLLLVHHKWGCIEISIIMSKTHPIVVINGNPTALLIGLKVYLLTVNIYDYKDLTVVPLGG